MEHVCGHYCTGTRQQVGGGSREAALAEAMVHSGGREAALRGGGNGALRGEAAGAEAIVQGGRWQQGRRQSMVQGAGVAAGSG